MQPGTGLKHPFRGPQQKSVGILTHVSLVTQAYFKLAEHAATLKEVCCASALSASSIHLFPGNCYTTCMLNTCSIAHVAT